MSKSKVTEEIRLQLVEMFLPELHQAWWTEALAQLGDEQRLVDDPETTQAIEARIREHYKLRHDVELTRKRLAPAASAFDGSRTASCPTQPLVDHESHSEVP